MSKCQVCGCTDNHACRGGCFWVDSEKTICSSCAVGMKAKNKYSGNIVKITNHGYFGQEVYGLIINNRYSLSAEDFIAAFEVQL